MADTYEKDLGVKSAITASDYIRLVGSDNVSYKNTVSSVAQSLNLNIGEIGGTSQSAFESNLLTKLSALGDGEIKMASVYPNYSNSFTSGARCPAVLYRYSSGIYKCEILSPKAWEGYYYSSAWHWSSDVGTTTAVTVTASTNVVIDTNKSYKMGKLLFLNVKGHTTAYVANAQLFTFSGVSADPYNFTFGIPVGSSAWAIDGIAYGYLNLGGVTATIQNGQYFHLAQVFLCA